MMDFYIIKKGSIISINNEDFLVTDNIPIHNLRGCIGGLVAELCPSRMDESNKIHMIIGKALIKSRDDVFLGNWDNIEPWSGKPFYKKLEDN